MLLKTEQLILSVLSALILAGFSFSNTGCGLIASMSSSSRYADRTEAEFQIAEHKGEKLLTIVKVPYWIESKANLGYYLTKFINRDLYKKAKFPEEQLISFDKLAELRTQMTGYSLLEPTAIAAELDADMVLLLSVQDYRMQKIADTDYYKADLTARAVIIDTKTEQTLWPASSSGKKIQIGFDVENKGFSAAVRRLASATAHCVTRYLYNCKVVEFKINEDKSDPAWNYWD